jgi:CRP/FNR family transcriptional regulator, cyclic AMP receptor protein
MAEKQHCREMLQAAWMFAGIPTEDIDLLSRNISIKAFRPGNTIFESQDYSQNMYIVLKGKVKAVNFNEDGAETILAIHGEGDSFGELALIDGNTAPAVIVVLEPSIIAFITKQHFYSILTSHRQVMWNVMNMLCSKLRAAWNNNAILTNNHGASERVTRILWQLVKEHGLDYGDNILINVRLTHQSLADMTGLTRAYLTRTLTKLQNEGIISTVKTEQGKRYCIMKA